MLSSDHNSRLLRDRDIDLYSVATYKMGKLLLIVFGISHWLACAWYYVGDLADDSKDADGTVVIGWCDQSAWANEY
eukprot:SAG31_NODE_1070_length_10071_cov_6.989771_15_plen_76_part_00